jgi:hypothetical protein
MSAPRAGRHAGDSLMRVVKWNRIESSHKDRNRRLFLVLPDRPREPRRNFSRQSSTVHLTTAGDPVQTRSKHSDKDQAA